MNKILLAILLILLLATGAVYIIIPSDIKISSVTLIKCTSQNINDCLHNMNTWKRWWPEYAASKTTPDSFFIYKGHGFKLIRPLRDGAGILLTTRNSAYPSKMLSIPRGRDSVTLEWETNFPASYNPVKRTLQYFEAFTIKKNMAAILGNLHQFAGDTKNIYGFPINRTTFTDTLFLATKFSSSSYPSINTIYTAIHKLKAKIAAAGGREKDFPMLSVNKKDSLHYETMIAICLNKEIKEDETSFITRMVAMKDRFLATEVTGGPSTIEKAHQAIQNYMEDRLLIAPAIPFEVLITDRSKETDTSNWKTKIFHPSM